MMRHRNRNHPRRLKKRRRPRHLIDKLISRKTTIEDNEDYDVHDDPNEVWTLKWKGINEGTTTIPIKSTPHKHAELESGTTKGPTSISNLASTPSESSAPNFDRLTSSTTMFPFFITSFSPNSSSLSDSLDWLSTGSFSILTAATHKSGEQNFAAVGDYTNGVEITISRPTTYSTSTHLSSQLESFTTAATDQTSSLIPIQFSTTTKKEVSFESNVQTANINTPSQSSGTYETKEILTPNTFSETLTIINHSPGIGVQGGPSSASTNARPPLTIVEMAPSPIFAPVENEGPSILITPTTNPTTKGIITSNMVSAPSTIAEIGSTHIFTTSETERNLIEPHIQTTIASTMKSNQESNDFSEKLKENKQFLQEKYSQINSGSQDHYKTTLKISIPTDSPTKATTELKLSTKAKHTPPQHLPAGVDNNITPENLDVSVKTKGTSELEHITAPPESTTAIPTDEYGKMHTIVLETDKTINVGKFTPDLYIGPSRNDMEEDELLNNLITGFRGTDMFTEEGMEDDELPKQKLTLVTTSSFGRTTHINRQNGSKYLVAPKQEIANEDITFTPSLGVTLETSNTNNTSSKKHKFSWKLGKNSKKTTLPDYETISVSEENWSGNTNKSGFDLSVSSADDNINTAEIVKTSTIPPGTFANVPISPITSSELHKQVSNFEVFGNADTSENSFSDNTIASRSSKPQATNTLATLRVTSSEMKPTPELISTEKSVSLQDNSKGKEFKSTTNLSPEKGSLTDSEGNVSANKSATNLSALQMEPTKTASQPSNDHNENLSHTNAAINSKQPTTSIPPTEKTIDMIAAIDNALDIFHSTSGPTIGLEAIAKSAFMDAGENLETNKVGTMPNINMKEILDEQSGIESHFPSLQKRTTTPNPILISKTENSANLTPESTNRPEPITEYSGTKASHPFLAETGTNSESSGETAFSISGNISLMESSIKVNIDFESTSTTASAPQMVANTNLEETTISSKSIANVNAETENTNRIQPSVPLVGSDENSVSYQSPVLAVSVHGEGESASEPTSLTGSESVKIDFNTVPEHDRTASLVATSLENKSESIGEISEMSTSPYEILSTEKSEKEVEVPNQNHSDVITSVAEPDNSRATESEEFSPSNASVTSYEWISTEKSSTENISESSLEETKAETDNVAETSVSESVASVPIMSVEVSKQETTTEIIILSSQVESVTYVEEKPSIGLEANQIENSFERLETSTETGSTINRDLLIFATINNLLRIFSENTPTEILSQSEPTFVSKELLKNNLLITESYSSLPKPEVSYQGSYKSHPSDDTGTLPNMVDGQLAEMGIFSATMTTAESRELNLTDIVQELGLITAEPYMPTLRTETQKVTSRIGLEPESNSEKIMPSTEIASLEVKTSEEAEQSTTALASKTENEIQHTTVGKHTSKTSNEQSSGAKEDGRYKTSKKTTYEDLDYEIAGENLITTGKIGDEVTKQKSATSVKEAAEDEEATSKTAGYGKLGYEISEEYVVATGSIGEEATKQKSTTFTKEPSKEDEEEGHGQNVGRLKTSTTVEFKSKTVTSPDEEEEMESNTTLVSIKRTTPQTITDTESTTIECIECSKSQKTETEDEEFISTTLINKKTSKKVVNNLNNAEAKDEELLTTTTSFLTSTDKRKTERYGDLGYEISDENVITPGRIGEEVTRSKSTTVTKEPSEEEEVSRNKVTKRTTGHQESVHEVTEEMFITTGRIMEEGTKQKPKTATEEYSEEGVVNTQRITKLTTIEPELENKVTNDNRISTGRLGEEEEVKKTYNKSDFVPTIDETLLFTSARASEEIVSPSIDSEEPHHHKSSGEEINPDMKALPQDPSIRTPKPKHGYGWHFGRLKTSTTVQFKGKTVTSPDEEEESILPEMESHTTLVSTTRTTPQTIIDIESTTIECIECSNSRKTETEDEEFISPTPIHKKTSKKVVNNLKNVSTKRTTAINKKTSIKVVNNLNNAEAKGEELLTTKTNLPTSTNKRTVSPTSRISESSTSSHQHPYILTPSLVSTSSSVESPKETNVMIPIDILINSITQADNEIAGSGNNLKTNDIDNQILGALLLGPTEGQLEQSDSGGVALTPKEYNGFKKIDIELGHPNVDTEQTNLSGGTTQQNIENINSAEMNDSGGVALTPKEYNGFKKIDIELGHPNVDTEQTNLSGGTTQQNIETINSAEMKSPEVVEEVNTYNPTRKTTGYGDLDYEISEENVTTTGRIGEKVTQQKSTKEPSKEEEVSTNNATRKTAGYGDLDYEISEENVVKAGHILPSGEKTIVPGGTSNPENTESYSKTDNLTENSKPMDEPSVPSAHEKTSHRERIQTETSTSYEEISSGPLKPDVDESTASDKSQKLNLKGGTRYSESTELLRKTTESSAPFENAESSSRTETTETKTKTSEFEEKINVSGGDVAQTEHSHSDESIEVNISATEGTATISEQNAEVNLLPATSIFITSMTPSEQLDISITEPMFILPKTSFEHSTELPSIATSTLQSVSKYDEHVEKSNKTPSNKVTETQDMKHLLKMLESKLSTSSDIIITPQESSTTSVLNYGGNSEFSSTSSNTNNIDFEPLSAIAENIVLPNTQNNTGPTIEKMSKMIEALSYQLEIHTNTETTATASSKSDITTSSIEINNTMSSTTTNSADATKSTTSTSGGLSTTKVTSKLKNKVLGKVFGNLFSHSANGTSTTVSSNLTENTTSHHHFHHFNSNDTKKIKNAWNKIVHKVKHIGQEHINISLDITTLSSKPAAKATKVSETTLTSSGVTNQTGASMSISWISSSSEESTNGAATSVSSPVSTETTIATTSSLAVSLATATSETTTDVTKTRSSDSSTTVGPTTSLLSEPVATSISLGNATEEILSNPQVTTKKDISITPTINGEGSKQTTRTSNLPRLETVTNESPITQTKEEINTQHTVKANGTKFVFLQEPRTEQIPESFASIMEGISPASIPTNIKYLLEAASSDALISAEATEMQTWTKSMPELETELRPNSSTTLMNADNAALTAEGINVTSNPLTKTSQTELSFANGRDESTTLYSFMPFTCGFEDSFLNDTTLTQHSSSINHVSTKTEKTKPTEETVNSVDTTLFAPYTSLYESTSSIKPDKSFLDHKDNTSVSEASKITNVEDLLTAIQNIEHVSFGSSTVTEVSKRVNTNKHLLTTMYPPSTIVEEHLNLDMHHMGTTKTSITTERGLKRTTEKVNEPETGDNTLKGLHNQPMILASTIPPVTVEEEHQNLDMHHLFTPKINTTKQTDTYGNYIEMQDTRSSSELENTTKTTIKMDTSRVTYKVGNQTCLYTPGDKIKSGKNMTTTADRRVFIALPTYYQNSTFELPNFEMYYTTPFNVDNSQDDERFDQTLNTLAFRAMKFLDFDNITEFTTTTETSIFVSAATKESRDTGATNMITSSSSSGSTTTFITSTAPTTSTTSSTSTSLSTAVTNMTSTRSSITSNSDAIVPSTTVAATKSAKNVVVVVASITNTNATSSTTLASNATTVATSVAASTTMSTSVATTTTMTSSITTVATTTSVTASLSVAPSGLNQNCSNKGQMTCLCSIDAMVKDLQEKSRNASLNSSLVNYMCESYVPLNASGIQMRRSANSRRRHKRSLAGFEFVPMTTEPPKIKREVILAADIKDALSKDVELEETDMHKYATPGSRISIRCADGKNFSAKEFNILWTMNRNVPLTGGKVQETGSGVLIIENVEPSDGGNYTCTVTNNQIGIRSFKHELSIVTLSTMDINTTILYEMQANCLKEDENILKTYFKGTIAYMLCGKEHRICTIDVINCTCLKSNNKSYLFVSLVFHMESMHVIVPTLNATQCDVLCQMKIYAKLVSVIVNNILVFETQPVIYKQSRDVTLTPSKYVFSPKEITDSPKLIVACPPGFGLLGDKHVCLACERNTYSNGGAAHCMPCPNRHFQPSSGSKSCIRCTSPFQDPACLSMMILNIKKYKLFAYAGLGVIVLTTLCIICMHCRSKKTHRKRKSKTRKPDVNDVELQTHETTEDLPSIRQRVSSLRKNRRSPTFISKAHAPPIPSKHNLQPANTTTKPAPPTPPPLDI